MIGTPLFLSAGEKIRPWRELRPWCSCVCVGGGYERGRVWGRGGRQVEVGGWRGRVVVTLVVVVVDVVNIGVKSWVMVVVHVVLVVVGEVVCELLIVE